MNPQETTKSCNDCGCKCHRWGSIAIILTGVVLLLGNLGYMEMGMVGIVWPVLLVLYGASKMCKC